MLETPGRPAGRARWNLSLLADEMVHLTEHRSLSPDTVRRRLASFFATLKGELVDHEAYATRAAATASIGDYIDAFYNTTRRCSTIGYVSPIEFELRLQSARRAA